MPIVRNGVIYLTGTTSNPADQRAVELLAEEVAPGHQAVNELVNFPAALTVTASSGGHSWRPWPSDERS
ncbi:MAG: BON domain-containing protein [Chloroflexi bacterium]|nr:BON domain-containing protein [Chloroflexota bacterium]